MKRKHPPQSHFDGKKFYNQYPTDKDRSLRELLRWLSHRKPLKWPKKVHVSQKQLPSDPVPREHVRLTFINHSTVLIQTPTLNILTDPIWSERWSPFKWMGPKRVSLPGIKFEELPPIHLVLLSHNHYDHFDLIQKKIGSIGVAMLPIGAYVPRWLMSPVHMSPEDAVQAHCDLKATKSLGIHFGTFQLGDEAYDDPVKELERHRNKAGLDPSDFVALQNGEGFMLHLHKS